jgi:hypothetical protein
MLYALAAIAIAAAAMTWPGSDGAVLGGLCVILAISAAATVFVLLEPVLPRVVWSVAAAAPVVAVVLVVLR